MASRDDSTERMNLRAIPATNPNLKKVQGRSLSVEEDVTRIQVAQRTQSDHSTQHSGTPQAGTHTHRMFRRQVLRPNLNRLLRRVKKRKTEIGYLWKWSERAPITAASRCRAERHRCSSIHSHHAWKSSAPH